MTTIEEAPPLDDEEAFLPPSDTAAEQSVLGAMMLSVDAIHDVVEHLGAADFYRPVHAQLFTCMTDLYARGDAVDAVTVGNDLRKRGDLARIGGLPYLHTLISTVPTAGNAAYYAEIVADKAVRRRLLEAGQRTSQLALFGDAATAEIVERARAALDDVAARARGPVDVADLDQLAVDALERYASPAPPALATGWHDLDAVMSGGLRDGTMTIVAARPGVGKSILAGNLALAAARQGVGALFVSLEMTRDELTDRMISNVGSVRLDRIVRHNLDQQEWGAVQDAVDHVAGLPLQIIDNPYLSVASIRSLARDRMRTPRGLSLLVVDYLQLVEVADPKAPREQQVSAMSRGFKLLAKELSIPVVIVAQLNRGPEQRADKRPQLSDLRESGSIEQDADAVWLLHVPGDPRFGELDVIVAKNRQGPVCDVTLSYSPHYTRIGSLAHRP